MMISISPIFKFSLSRTRLLFFIALFTFSVLSSAVKPAQAATPVNLDFSKYAPVTPTLYQTSDIYNGAVAPAGDVDGDGYQDFLIGDHETIDYPGVAYLVYGKASGWASTDVSQLVKFSPVVAQKLGYAVMGVGDVNGDGYADFAISAPVATSNGAVYLFYGGATRFTSRSVSQANVTFTISTEHNSSGGLGDSITKLGDLDGDGYADFAIGATSGSDNGSVYLVYGKNNFSAQVALETYDAGTATGTITNGVIKLNGENIYTLTGTSLASGDVDGDSKRDLLIGAPSRDVTTTQAGTTYLVYGKDLVKNTMSGTTQNLASLAAVTFTGENAKDEAGYAVTMGDLDGNGKADIIIGAPMYVNNFLDPNFNRGKVYVVYDSTVAGLSGANALGSAANVAYLGEATNNEAGYALGIGDVNGDGKSDVLIGATSIVYLLYGNSVKPSGSIALSDSSIVKFTGQFGSSLGILPNINGDTFDDLILSGDYVVNGNQLGAVGIEFGKAALFTSGTLPFSDMITINEQTDSTKTGASIAGVGDVNGDGFVDFLVGAPTTAASPNGKGVVYLVYGGLGNTSTSTNLENNIQFTGEGLNDQAGFAVAAAGDVNGDGYADMLIGAPYNDSNGLTDNGAVYLVYGAANLASKSLSDTSIKKFTGETANEQAGSAIVTFGNVVAIGAPGNNSNAGLVYVLAANVMDTAAQPATLGFKADFALLGGTNDRAGTALAGVSNVAGSTNSFLLVGAPSNSSHPGSVYVLYNTTLTAHSLDNTDLNLSSADAQLLGENNNDQAGYSVAIGDVVGDSKVDIIVGAPNNDNTSLTNNGAVYVIDTSAGLASSFNLVSSTVKLKGEAGNDQTGYSVASAGDLNNDGKDDLLFGSPHTLTSGNARAYVVFGSTNATLPAINASTTDGQVIRLDTNNSDQTGYAVASIGDYTHRNRPALALGAPLNGNGARGAIYVGYPYMDNDSDGYNLSFTGFPNSVDCNDFSNTIHPGATEMCDGIDNNCNDPGDGSGIDEGLPTSTTYIDSDNDNYGDVNDTPQTSCAAPGYRVTDNTDCVDSDLAIHPGATEMCNAVDDNCNGQIDEGLDIAAAGYADLDGDGYGDINSPSPANTCLAPGYYVADNTDCNDNDPTVHALTTYYKNNDPTQTVQICGSAPAGYSGTPQSIPSTTTNTNTNTTTAPTPTPSPSPAPVTIPVVQPTTPPSTQPIAPPPVVTDVQGATNGNIQVFFSDGSKRSEHIFNVTTQTLTVVLKYPNSTQYLVLHPFGQKLAVIEPSTGAKLSQVRLTKKNYYINHAIRLVNIRPQDHQLEIVIISKQKHSKIRSLPGRNLLSLLHLNFSDTENFKLLSQITLTAKKITPNLTQQSGNNSLNLFTTADQLRRELWVNLHYQIIRLEHFQYQN